MRASKHLLTLAILLSISALSACGGAGSTPAATATATPTASLSGTLIEYTSGLPLSGFTVTLGTGSDFFTCNSAQTQAVNACEQVASITATTTTSPSGAFSLSNIPVGSYLLVIKQDSTYATLHRWVALSSGQASLGTVKLSALSGDEQRWLVDVNTKRATVSYPASFANLVIDEYAEEQARAEASAVAAGAYSYSDATEGTFLGLYLSSPGVRFSGGSGVADLQPAASAYVAADQAFFAEKANCPNGNWQTCVWAENTGHYIALSNTQDTWIGLGESSTSYHYAGGGIPLFQFRVRPSERT